MQGNATDNAAERTATCHHADRARQKPDHARAGRPRLLPSRVRRTAEASTLARLAYVARDGGPRRAHAVHWTGRHLVMVTYAAGPKAGIAHPARGSRTARRPPLRALDSVGTLRRPCSCVAGSRWTRWTASPPVYAAAAQRYLGSAQAMVLLGAVDQPGTRQARLGCSPRVGLTT